MGWSRDTCGMGFCGTRMLTCYCSTVCSRKLKSKPTNQGPCCVEPGSQVYARAKVLFFFFLMYSSRITREFKNFYVHSWHGNKSIPFVSN